MFGIGAGTLSGQAASKVPGCAKAWQATSNDGPNIPRKDESSPQVFVLSSEQQPGIVKAGSPGMFKTSCMQVLVPQLTDWIPASPPEPARAAVPLAPAWPALPPLPPVAVVVESEVLPQAGTAIAAITALTAKTRAARKNMAQESFTLSY
jgi:hypothetical protein